MGEDKLSWEVVRRKLGIKRKKNKKGKKTRIKEVMAQKTVVHSRHPGLA